MLGVDGLNPVKPTKGEPRRAKSTLKPRTNTEPDKKSSMPSISLPQTNSNQTPKVEVNTANTQKSLYEEIVKPFERNAAKDP